METDAKTENQTSEAALAERGDSAAQDGLGATAMLPSRVVLQRETNGRWKKLRGNENSRKHGMRAINQAWRDKLPIDHKTQSGKVEQQVFTELVHAFGAGDTDKIDVTTHILIQLVAYDCGRWHQHRLSKKTALTKIREEARKKGQKIPRNPHPKFLSLLESYEQPTINSLRAGLAALGKPPDRDAPKLQDILNAIADETEQESEDGNEESSA